MKFNWLMPDRLKLFLLLIFWSFEWDGLFFQIKYAIAYGENYLWAIGETLLSALIIYAIICALLLLHTKLCKRSKGYLMFWAPQKAKLVLAVILTIVSITSYIAFVALAEKNYQYYPALFTTLFFVAVLLNIIPSFYASGGYDFGIFRFEDFLEISGSQSDTGPWVYHAHYLLIIPMILSALIWNYFISCLVFFILYRWRK